jgi:hypothetical protein
MDEETQNVLKAYDMTFNRKEGKLVMMDLEAAFHDRVNPEVERELEEIPHPYREYVVRGQRSVIQKIKAAMELSKQPVEETDDGTPIT